MQNFQSDRDGKFDIVKKVCYNVAADCNIFVTIWRVLCESI